MDSAEAAFYLDPPYLRSTRNVSGEMEADDQHRHLLELLNSCRGAVVLSGYRSELYDEVLSGGVALTIGCVRRLRTYAPSRSNRSGSTSRQWQAVAMAVVDTSGIRCSSTD
ncbi:hypothetical protein ACIBO2_29475 [Nonomuraea sp. NPDC050022]|uniref:hypothetical protein n=1 Tax=unclassified Nonomuraea TaxID=2593643 RepID=UPI0033E0C32B